MQPGDRFHDALSYASRLHAAQRRKGGQVPYVAHLLAVTAIVLEHGGNEDEAVAALLHDAVEDQGGAPRLAEIRARFGVVVADIVAGCTDADTTPKPPWQERKDRYLAHLPAAGRSVQLVAAADKLHNLRSLIEDYRRSVKLFGSALTGAAAVRSGTIGPCSSDWASCKVRCSSSNWNARSSKSNAWPVWARTRRFDSQGPPRFSPRLLEIGPHHAIVCTRWSQGIGGA